jgi:hypothetical protein
MASAFGLFDGLGGGGIVVIDELDDFFSVLFDLSF